MTCNGAIQDRDVWRNLPTLLVAFGFARTVRALYRLATGRATTFLGAIW